MHISVFGILACRLQDECEDLRERVKAGLLRRPTVVRFSLSFIYSSYATIDIVIFWNDGSGYLILIIILSKDSFLKISDIFPSWCMRNVVVIPVIMHYLEMKRTRL